MVVHAHGQPVTKRKWHHTVPPELVTDMLPPRLMQHSSISRFRLPRLPRSRRHSIFPNVFNAAPGTKSFFLSFDHMTRLVMEMVRFWRTASVVTDSGMGTTKPVSTG